jgi:VRR-NUC domain
MAKKLKDPNVLPPLTESQFLRQVIELATLHGFRCFHQRPGMTRKGKWCSAVQGQGVGFPDLVLVHPARGRVIFAELKTYGGQPTQAQVLWLGDLISAGAEMYLWRPNDWDEIVKVLT